MKLEVAICNLKFMVGRRRRQTFVERDTQVTELVPIVQRPIEQVIVLIRNEKVILDVDLASLYGVTVRRLNEQVRRNSDRFPEDFMFQLTKTEVESLRSQNATANKGRGGRTSLPLAFTEHGAIMAATILSSPRAVEMSVFVVRAFIRLRESVANHREITTKLEQLERKVNSHDAAISQLFNVIRQLTQSTTAVQRRIGFAPKEGPKSNALKRKAAD